MTVNRTRVFWLIGLLLFAWCSYWCYENFTIEEVRFPASLKGEALSNDLFAAVKFVAAMGAEAKSSFGYRQPPAGTPASSVLVLPTMRRTLVERQRNELLRWVESGGHLVVVTYTLEDESKKKDPLLSLLGVRQYRTEEGKRTMPSNPDGDEEDGDEDDDVKKAKRDEEQSRRRLREAQQRLQKGMPQMPLVYPERSDCPSQVESGSLSPRFPVAHPSLRVCFDPRFRLEADGEKLWAVQSKHGVHALTVARGAGKVTILTDYAFMYNNRIGHADHADFVAALVGLNDAAPARQVLLIPREDVPGVLTLMWKYLWPVVLMLAGWLVLAVWRAATRVGPSLPAPQLARRSLAEHVRASGEFLWRHGQRGELWRATRALTERHIERSLPAASFRNKEEHMQALAKRSGIAPTALSQLLESKYAPPAEQFATTIATLDKLRKSL